MSKKNDKNNKAGIIRHVALIFLGTFVCAVCVSFCTNLVVEQLTSVIPLIILTLVVIGLGVLFDCVGVAALGADDAPFHARAAKKKRGAKKTLGLLKKADVVANVCCDVIGDICGIVSGALGATLVLMLGNGTGDTILLSVGISALISAFTVGGKAAMKGVAVSNANTIMEVTGKILDVKHNSSNKNKNNS